MTSAVRSLPRHPRTGLRALAVGRRGPIWPVMGGSQPLFTEPAAPPAGGGDPQPAPTPAPAAGGPPAPAAPPATGAAEPPEYPANTPLTEMTVEQQLAYWRAHARKHEDRVKAMGDYDAVKAKAAEYDRLAEASKTEAQRAVEAARAEGRTDGYTAAQREYGAELVAARFAAAAAGRMSDEQVQAYLDTFDHTKFLTDDGKVDAERIRGQVDRFAPAGGAPPTGAAWPDLGQGRRGGTVKPSLASGVERYRQLHPAPTTTANST